MKMILKQSLVDLPLMKHLAVMILRAGLGYLRINSVKNFYT